MQGLQWMHEVSFLPSRWRQNKKQAADSLLLVVGTREDSSAVPKHVLIFKHQREIPSSTISYRTACFRSSRLSSVKRQGQKKEWHWTSPEKASHRKSNTPGKSTPWLAQSPLFRVRACIYNTSEPSSDRPSFTFHVPVGHCSDFHSLVSVLWLHLHSVPLLTAPWFSPALSGTSCTASAEAEKKRFTS